jgi:hypothetical protein
MEMDLTKYGIEELVELQNKIGGIINDYKDGYFYICEVRSYGRNWKDNYIFNTHTLQELCYQYSGEDGIVDVYSNNPYLEIDNYGDVMFVPTVEDYEKWVEYTSLSNSIPNAEEQLDKWDNRDNVPFMYRPTFSPFWTREDVEDMKAQVANFDMSFVAPVRVNYIEPDEEE